MMTMLEGTKQYIGPIFMEQNTETKPFSLPSDMFCKGLDSGAPRKQSLESSTDEAKGGEEIFPKAVTRHLSLIGIQPRCLH